MVDPDGTMSVESVIASDSSESWIFAALFLNPQVKVQSATDSLLHLGVADLTMQSGILGKARESGKNGFGLGLGEIYPRCAATQNVRLIEWEKTSNSPSGLDGG